MTKVTHRSYIKREEIERLESLLSQDSTSNKDVIKGLLEMLKAEYVDEVGSGGGFRLSPVQSLTELAALSVVNLKDKNDIYVENQGGFYFYDADAVGGDVAPDDQIGGVGFWKAGQIVSGDGDMHRAIYDPFNRELDVYNMDNHIEGTGSKKFTDAYKAILDNIDPNAEVNQTDAEIKVQYENNANTNAFTDALLSKLQGIESGAQVNPLNTDYLTEGSGNRYYKDAYVSANIDVSANTLARHTHSNSLVLDAITGSGSGVIISESERTKLLGIEAGAQVNPDAAQIKVLYESNDDTNAFDNTWYTKLSNIEDGAQVNPSPAEIAIAYESNADTNKFTDAYKDKIDLGAAFVDPVDVKTLYESNADTNAFTDSLLAKLVSIDETAEPNQSDAEIKTQYEANANTNEFSDAYLAKLLGIEEGAEVNPTAAETKTAYESNADTNAFTDVEKTKLGLLTDPEHTIHVSKSGGDFTTLAAALASITDNGPTNRYVILVYPGIYVENNPLPLKAYVAIMSVGTLATARITAQNDTANLFEAENTPGGFMYIQDLAFNGVGVGYAGLSVTTPVLIEARNIAVFNCDKGFHIDNANCLVSITEGRAYTASGTIDKYVHVESGELHVRGYNVIDDSVVNTSFYLEGVNTKAHLSHLYSRSTNMTTGLLAINGCTVTGTDANAENGTDGIVIYGDNTTVDFSALSFRNMTNDSVRVENTGTNIKVAFFASEIRDAGRYSINVENPDCTLIGNGLAELAKVNAVSGSRFYAQIIDLAAFDEGTSIFGELKVGTPLNPVESVFGEGDSYTRGMLAFYWNETAGSFTNITSDLSDPTTAWTMPDVTTDSAIYFASAIFNGTDVLKHYGIKMMIETAATLGGGSTVWEYWNGSSWVELHNMTRLSHGDYQSYAENIFDVAGSFQIRLDPLVVNATASDWAKNDPISFGTPLFWTRLRIGSTLTSAPTINQFKMSSNRIELNQDGFATMHGAARPRGTLAWTINNAQAWASSPGNQDLYALDSPDGANFDLGVGRIENLFANGATDKVGLMMPVPEDMDTSGPMEVEVYYVADSNVAGNITYVSSKGITGVGEPMGFATNNAPTSIRDYEIVTAVIPVASNSAYTLLYMKMNVYFSKAIAQKDPDGSSDMLNLAIGRLGGADTYGGDTAIAQIRINYYKWALGGHIK
jgi:hypothetical protein